MKRKKPIVLHLIALVVVGFLFLFFWQGTITGNIISDNTKKGNTNNYCEDSDGGIFTTIGGAVLAKDSWWSRDRTIRADTCLGDKKQMWFTNDQGQIEKREGKTVLREYYCEGGNRVKQDFTEADLGKGLCITTNKLINGKKISVGEWIFQLDFCKKDDTGFTNELEQHYPVSICNQNIYYQYSCDGKKIGATKTICRGACDDVVGCIQGCLDDNGGVIVCPGSKDTTAIIKELNSLSIQYDQLITSLCKADSSYCFYQSICTINPLNQTNQTQINQTQLNQTNHTRVNQTNTSNNTIDKVYLKNNGRNELDLINFPLISTRADIPLFYTDSNKIIGIGKDVYANLRTDNGEIGAITFYKDTDYAFIASYSDGTNVESYIMRAINFKTVSGVNLVTLQYLKDGSWTNAQVDAKAGDTLSLGNTQLSISTIGISSAYKGKYAVVASNSAQTSFNTLYSDNGLMISLPFDSTTGHAGAINLANNPTTYDLKMYERDSSGQIGSGDVLTATIGLNAQTPKEIQVSSYSYSGTGSNIALNYDTSPNQHTLTLWYYPVFVDEGKTQKVLIDGKEYSVQITFIDSTSVKFKVDNEETNKLSTDQSYLLSNNLLITAKTILYSSQATGTSSASFILE